LPKNVYLCANQTVAIMRHELYIARRMQLGGSATGSGSPSLRVALVGIVLAVVVMILSIVIVMGFKDEITGKIYSLDAHLKVTNAVLGIDDNYSTVNGREVMSAISQDSSMLGRVSSMGLVADKPAILKTDEDFMGINLRGVDGGYDLGYLQAHLVEGRLPAVGDTASGNEVMISRHIADRLQLHAGESVLTYFIDNAIKVRKLNVAGVYETDLEAFDKAFVVGGIGIVQQVNGWHGDMGSQVEVNLRDVDHLDDDAYQLYTLLASSTVSRESPTLYTVTTTRQNNMQYFAWLDMLDMNVVVILTLMMVVAAFTLVSAMLMIVLERIRFIGMFKALGASNGSIRRIFIFLTGKLILRALLLGNIIGIGLALLQRYCHIVRLDPSAYYMPYVPVTISIPVLVLLNVGIVVVSYLTLLGPSYIISTIKPTSTMRFE